jgi:hypothetical protein
MKNDARAVLERMLDDQPDSALRLLAADDYDRAAGFIAIDHPGGHEALSEAVLSALALGLTLGVNDPETAKKWLAEGAAAQRKAQSSNAINARHDQPGGSRDLARQIREIWATGKYSSREICAEEEWAGLGYGSFSAARNALRNTPEPT